jgi:hypothetical protein
MIEWRGFVPGTTFKDGCGNGRRMAGPPASDIRMLCAGCLVVAGTGMPVRVLPWLSAAGWTVGGRRASFMFV